MDRWAVVLGEPYTSDVMDRRWRRKTMAGAYVVCADVSVTSRHGPLPHTSHWQRVTRACRPYGNPQLNVFVTSILILVSKH